MLEAIRTSGWVLFFGVLAIFIGLLLATMAVFGFGFFSNATANFRGNVAKNNLTKANGNYRIAAYERFYDECAGIQTDEAQIKQFSQQVKSDQKGSQQESIDRINLTAAIVSRQQDINQYNADSRKSGTLAQFRASDLPYQIDPTIKETTCTA